MSRPELEKRHIISLSTFVFLGFVAYMLYCIFIKTINSELEKELNSTGIQTIKEFSNIVKNDIRELNNLKNRLEVTNGMFYEYWTEDAMVILEQNQSFKFIEWIDSAMVIRKIVPEKGNEKALGLNISNVKYRVDDWRNSVKNATTNITPWAEMTQGGKAFLVDIPVYFQNNFQGTITAGMDFKSHFDFILSTLEEEYAVLIEDENQAPFYEYNKLDKSSIVNTPHIKKLISIEGFENKDWTFWFTPLHQHPIVKKKQIANLSLAAGIIFSILTSLLIYFYMSAQKENKKVYESNERLIHLNKSLKDERFKAEKASKAKTEFLSNMSHEIRTPLNAILGFIEVLKDSELSENHKKYLSLMDLSSKKLLNLINDILEFDRIESGKTELKEHVFSPVEELENIISLYKLSAQEKKVGLSLHFNRNNHHNVIGDAGKFGQIFTNLIRNSIKFTDKGTIVITYDERVEYNVLYLKITVKDTGIGIPKNKLSTIFNRFTQVDAGKTKKHEGGGIGLSITYHLLELMKGTINVSSSEHIGSEFEVKLHFPLTNKERKPEEHINTSALDLSNLKVLIVDDNKLNVTVLEKAVERFGIVNPQKAENGHIAIQLAGSDSYDLIFMDIHMPEMDGFDATSIIRKFDSKVIIFGLSANVTKEAIDEAISVGMNDYITKPFSLKKLYVKLYYYFAKQNVIK
ncbi:response regulator [Zhouia spongiae]|uniref:histidine kinase n=1 Tax=Zhouia spongiae TaxID=2202721 RepID=A0ABY3YP87_9FLAO|nr:response regulator [Zhouia spongiae]UNY99430.1 response regulator [Zhouia spongiae]